MTRIVTSTSRLILRVALIALLAVGLVATGVLASLGGTESRLKSAADELGTLPLTRLTALPAKEIANGTTSLRVRFSGTPASFSPKPVLHPAVEGTWVVHGRSEFFTPTSTLAPCSTYTLSIPAASTARGHAPLGKRRAVSLQVACPSVRGLQQTLARLDYLPYVARSRPSVRAMGPLPRRSLAARDAFAPARSDPDARIDNAPALEYGQMDETTKGAVMVFQGDHGIEATGIADSATWKALFRANAHAQRNREPYTFVTVSESIPETLEVHRGSHVVLSTPVNTGVPGAETAQGIFPIVTRFQSTTMTGTNPDGSHYSDPGVPWVNYFNGGDAVHGFPRDSYGTPQSNGCVELPIETAQTVYGMLKLGDVVEVKA